MPSYVIHDTAVEERLGGSVGGKALALARLQRAGLAVPAFAVVTSAAYTAFLAANGLRERILFELDRKEFADMGWEELWDASLRIRNLFLTTAMPDDLAQALRDGLAGRFADVATVVRSSAPGEDSASASFAGLHESYVNVRGVPAIVEHVKLVWASLWSDGALLYRRELGLDPLRSTMAVVVQEIVAGERSGVAFSADPADGRRALVEAVHGLNQGLVDGTVEPDRWVLERTSGRLLEHRAAERREMVAPSADGVRLEPLDDESSTRPPLDAADVPRVYALARAAEASFGTPQDVEWTLRCDDLFALQARPITTGGGAADGRAAYLSLRRSFDNLRRLQSRIEDEALPEMDRQASAFAAVDLAELDDTPLLAELERRKASHDHWVDVYVQDFIPFAHGARLFGEAYNDALQPDDPYEFADALAATPMISTQRNDALAGLARLARGGDDEGLQAALGDFMRRYGDTTGGAAGLARERDAVEQVARRLAERPPAEAPGERPDPAALAAHFVASFPEDQREHAEGLLELGRASWRLRDDDNIYLSRVEGQLHRALEEAGRRDLPGLERFAPRTVELPSPLSPEEAAGGAAAAASAAENTGATDAGATGARTRARQIVGQPAGPGIASGAARVVRGREDLFAFAPGEVLVCDSIEPTMTFVVPLAAGIVERRGGMLIHGAIIAREYGLPCVTGVPRATELISTGDRVTVDGYLGIVVVG